MIQAIVFDFGNVIGYFDHSLATKKLACLCDWSSENLLSYFFGGKLEDDYEAGRLTTAEFLRLIRAHCNFKCSEDELAAIYGDIFKPNEDMPPLLHLLKGKYRLLLGSNTSELHSRRFRGQFAETLKLFDAVVLSHDIGCRKPNAPFFEHCQRSAKCSATECLFIDDLPTNVAGAVACGWHAILFTSVPNLIEKLIEINILDANDAAAIRETVLLNKTATPKLPQIDTRIETGRKRAVRN